MCKARAKGFNPMANQRSQFCGSPFLQRKTRGPERCSQLLKVKEEEPRFEARSAELLAPFMGAESSVRHVYLRIPATPSKWLVEGESGVSQETGLLDIVSSNTLSQARAFMAGFSSP